MAGSLSDYAENKVLDHITGKTSFTMPTIYLAASTADPLDAGTGLTEPVGGAYARVATTGTDWNAAASGSVTNATELTFPTATGNWGTITHGAGMDAATSGNMIFHADFETARAINTDDTLTFPIGSITLTLA